MNILNNPTSVDCNILGRIDEQWKYQVQFFRVQYLLPKDK